MKGLIGSRGRRGVARFNRGGFLRRPKLARSVLFATPLLGAAIVASLFSVSHADRPQGRCAGDPQLGDLANGEGAIAILNHDVVVVGEESSACLHQRTVLKDGLLRHVAAQPGTGTAFVKDVAGEDTLVVMTPEGTSEIVGEGEVTQPAWSPEGDLVWASDMESLSVLTPAASSPRSIPAPRSAIGLFSPRFDGTGSVVAVAQEAVAGAPAEDDALNNIFEYDLSSQSWTRLTSFTATAEDWNAIRTPQVMPDGSVLFVRVQGNVHETGLPEFELWRESEGHAELMRELPQEMYLAGVRGEALLWNISTSDCGDWELFVEEASGLRSLGCGAVAVDPVNLVDPDLVAHEEEEAAPQTSGPVAVVVGDFGTRRAANRFARALGTGGLVVGHTDAPSVVRPGSFAIAERVPAAADPEARLTALKKMVGSREVFIAPFPKKP